MSIKQLLLNLCREASVNRSDWAFMRRFEIPSFDEPEVNYLTRGRLVQTPWFGVYLHKFDRPDSRPTLHDHPWNFVSFVIGGKGYIEYTGLEKQQHRVRWFNAKRATDLHWISELLSDEVWTLMFVGRRQRVWGYVDEADDPTFLFPLTERHTWTRFDIHPYALEFDHAMMQRKQMNRNQP